MRKKYLLKAFVLFASVSLIYSFGERQIVKIESFKQANSIALNLLITKGYGVQKKAANKLTLYKLLDSHKKYNKVKDKIKFAALPLQTIKVLQGKTAKEDKKYYSTLKTVKFKHIKQLKGDYAIGGKLFYCSFSQKFCSVQSVYKIVQ